MKMFQWPFLIIIVIIIISGCSSSIPELNYTPTEQYSLDKYSYSVDLTRVKNDRVYVHLHCPGLDQNRVIFHFPKTIPGTYRELDYGEMIQEFKAKDSQGDTIPVQKIGNNIFEITQDICESEEMNGSWTNDKCYLSCENIEICCPL